MISRNKGTECVSVDDVASNISQALRCCQPFDAPRILDDSFGGRAQFWVALHALRHDDARLVRNPFEPVGREWQRRLEPLVVGALEAAPGLTDLHAGAYARPRFGST